MEMKIGAKLTELRRAKRLTQNQLADMLGISAPAVSKWETDSSYPDITLLCPLARALDTSVDTLLQFEETLSNEEIVEKMNSLIEAAMKEGYETGESMLSGLLHEYPNSCALKFNAAIAYDTFRMFFPTAGEEQQKRWTDRKKQLLTELRASGTSAYRQQAALNLAGMAIQAGELEKGEQLLKELPEHSVDPTLTWFQLYTKQGKPEEALKLTQKRLYTLVRQAAFCLTSMMGPEITDNPEHALKICEVYKSLDLLFGLGGMYEGMFLDIYLRMGRLDDAADSFVRYVDAITGEAVLPKSELFSPGLDIKEHQPATTKEIQKMLLTGLEDESFKPLLADPRCMDAIKKLKEGI
ncbi:MAG: helix-turn-helix domain-containing protein [Dorea sp.]|nr:helix-turn-helix domain-containing protein [Dorea sp.]